MGWFCQTCGAENYNRKQFFLEQFDNGSGPTKDTMMLFCLYDQSMTAHLEEILEGLAIRWSEIIWTDELLVFQEHEVWRQDDSSWCNLLQTVPKRQS